jgi:hypothetical protein
MPTGAQGVRLSDLRRVTITIPDELEKALGSYTRDLEFPPSLAAEMIIEDRR